MSRDAADVETPKTSATTKESSEPDLSNIGSVGQRIVGEESGILAKVKARIEHEAQRSPETIENLDEQLIELRDLIAEAKEEDVPSLIGQMHQVAALSKKRGQGRSVPIDPKSPYFGHLRLKEARSGRSRDVLIGRHTLLDSGDGLSIVDWRNAPVSRLYYRYEEDDEYDEEFDDRTIEGQLLLRRSLVVADGELRRVVTPQGAYAFTRDGRWIEVETARPTLEGGSGTAARVKNDQLGVHGDTAEIRADKHLQEITALIDKHQFELITKPESGIVLIQGGAGSGKTTVALHRVAFLAFQDGRRFQPSKMLVVVYNTALVEYIRHVLPSLGVEGVGVTTYRHWAKQLVARIKLRIPVSLGPPPPDVVSRFKKNPVIMRLLERLVAEQLTEIREALVERVASRPGGQEVVDVWDRSDKLPPLVRASRLLDWLNDGAGVRLNPKARTPAVTIMRGAKEQLGDIVSDWLEINTATKAIANAIREHAPNGFTETDIDAIGRWCAQKAELDHEEDGEEESVVDVGMDPEDYPILLRLLQLKQGGVFINGKRFEYEHVVIDEAQDLCPLEVRVLLDCVSRGRSVTIAGDKAQKMVFDNGFVDWPQLLDDAGLPHVAIQPLKITYRSTREVMEFSHHVLGEMKEPDDQLIARPGAPVGFFGFSATGEAVAFLGDALRQLMRREPGASVALLARYPQQADLYYDALKVAEVPRLRRVRREDFSFTAGIDVTDVRQVKGLEFDYVVILDPTRQNYPEMTQARHLLHIAATRAAYQLWVVCAGEPSALIPPKLVEGVG